MHTLFISEIDSMIQDNDKRGIGKILSINNALDKNPYSVIPVQLFKQQKVLKTTLLKDAFNFIFLQIKLTWINHKFLWTIAWIVIFMKQISLDRGFGVLGFGG